MREAENKEDALKKDVETGKNDSGKRQNEDRLQKAFVKNEIITADLSVQEIDYICRKITPKAIRAYFQHYPQEYAKIRPGIRATSLPDEMAIQLVIKNSTKRFVSSFINKYLSVWRQEIKEYQEELEMKGESPQKALIKTILKSVFDGNVPLFFRVTGNSCSEEYMALVEEAALLLKEKEKQKQKQKESISEISEKKTEKSTKDLEIGDLQEKIRHLSDQVVRLRQELENGQSAYCEAQNNIAGLSERNSALESKIAVLKERMKDSEDKAARSQAELEKIHKLLKYSDEDMGENQSEEFPYTSIGQVLTDSNGKKWCRRLADIENRNARRFIRNEDEPPYFDNRDKLPVFDGPETDGFIGVWNWSAVENYKDANRDYVKTQYNSSIKYIEVVELTECHSCEDISGYLAGNIFSDIVGSKILFVYRVTEKEMSGLLCGTRELEFYDGCVRLKTDEGSCSGSGTR